MRFWSGRALVALAAGLLFGGSALAAKKDAPPADTALCSEGSDINDEAVLDACDRLLAQPITGSQSRTQYRLRRVDALKGLRRYREAIAGLDEILEDNPRDAAALKARARLRLYADPKQSPATLEAVVADGAAALAANPDDPELWMQQGIFLGRLHRWQEALDSFDKAKAAGADGQDITIMRAGILIELGRGADARAGIDAGLEKEPDNVPLWMMRSLTWGPTEQEQALADLDKALASEPDLKYARERRLTLLVQLDRLDEAEAIVNKSLEENPEDYDALYWRASLRANRGQYAQALQDLDAILPRNNDQGRAYNLSCYVRTMANQQLDQAQADCEAALKLRPDFPPYLDSRGLLRLRMGQFDLAIADYDAALAKAPDLAESLYGRGLGRLRKGQTAEGQADLAAAVAKERKIADDFAGWGLKP